MLEEKKKVVEVCEYRKVYPNDVTNVEGDLAGLQNEEGKSNCEGKERKMEEVKVTKGQRKSEEEHEKEIEKTENEEGVQTVPVITEPFEKIAFDIVGPFPTTKDGYKYILSTICLASKYPEAILLKDVRAETVAEGMAEVFSRIGVSRQLLTDQGSQFVGKMVQQLCRKLNIEKLQTTPYHPQSNGCLERWHGTVVPMLKRCLEDKLDWSKQLKYVLFACRCAPNRDSGFSPFEIIFGRHIRGPLELLKDVWETEEKNVCDWVAELQDRLESKKLTKPIA